MASAKQWTPALEVSEWYFGLGVEWRRELRACGSARVATKNLLRRHKPRVSSIANGKIFYLMLAYYQCRDGCLQPEIRRRALSVIARGADSVLWLNMKPSTPKRRQADFDRLKELILSQ
jgi:hypothetical protein